MTRTEYIQWSKALVKQLDLTLTTIAVDGQPVPFMTIDVHYSWKGKRLTKSIHSVLN